MPVTVVVGGQFGSEGKGKVAHFFAAEDKATAAVRVGGSNSGHTVIGPNGHALVLRHLPTGCVLPHVTSIIPPGSYLDVPVLLREIALVGVMPDRLSIDPHAWIIADRDKDAERRVDLPGKIGSTGSGTGAAFGRRVSRAQDGTFAKQVVELQPFIRDTTELLSGELKKGRRVIVEGTQGFGLSLLHSGQYPHCTSRDTTAAAFVSEAGLSPLDIDQIILVIRSHPIRVAGQSGVLLNETSWQTVTQESGSPESLVELTSVTQKVRRIAHFDADVVKRAISHNRPTTIALNHLDYVDFQCRLELGLTKRALAFIDAVENGIGNQIDLVGFSPSLMQWRQADKKRAVNG